MFLNCCSVLLVSAIAPALCVSVRRAGWLDRLVQHHKDSFYNDLLALAPLQIEARIERAPPGYRDSEAWTYESILHLLILISQSERARPVKATLRALLAPSRRLGIGKKASFRIFPSLSKNIENYLYYDMESDVEYPEEPQAALPDEDAVLVVTNPVEARLPSARVSVRLIRDILEARAQAARIMPSTTRSTFAWKTMNTTRAAAANATSGSDVGTGGTADAKETTAAGTGSGITTVAATPAG